LAEYLLGFLKPKEIDLLSPGQGPTHHLFDTVSTNEDRRGGTPQGPKILGMAHHGKGSTTGGCRCLGEVNQTGVCTNQGSWRKMHTLAIVVRRLELSRNAESVDNYVWKKKPVDN
jgi:hypothetical protein